MSRYAFPVPLGWFYIADSDSIAPGELREVRRFERDLVLWRSESGKIYLNDAYCPHLGAHVGRGGQVIGETIQCPFHKWTFKGDGKVSTIPYAPKINERACLPAYPILEHYGNIMAWYHPDGAPPSFDLPAVPELDGTDFVGPLSEHHHIHTCLQEMAENTVDGAHFVTIHEHPGEAHYEGVSFDGPRMWMDSKQLFPSSKGPVEGTLTTESFGYGFGIVRYKTLADIVMVTVNAPVERDVTEQIFKVYYRNPQKDPKLDRIGQAFYKEVNRQVRQDIPIWENKIYRERPFLCEGDGPILRFRHWAKQFYVEPSAVKEPQHA